MEAYRYGGEEFLVLAAPGGGAAAAAESIVKRVSELGIPFDASPFGKVTISAGCSARGNAAASLAALIKQADKALYKAKQSGRNRAAYA
ncbi:diguanylate cyclase [Cloacibacillus evryensis]|uniref:diguanylate cyclase n=1 Tax=Cloacibacillus evryensis TaxID=508460 RepID=UPI00210D05E7|nr:diguanylate cyclase [Cloacibacillus evryensis]MCQ4764990.1 diguanylate cyclase [Cloacibacillus evryensis]